MPRVDPLAYQPPSNFSDYILCGITEVPVTNAKGELTHYTTQPVSIKPAAGTIFQHGNLLVAGPAGSGKGTFLKANCKSWKHSMVITDLKGDTYRETALDRTQYGEVYVVDTRHATGHHFDPFRVLPLDQWHQMVQVIVSASNDDGFWMTVATDMWLACLHAARHAQRPHIPYAMDILSLGVVEALRYFLVHHKDDAATMRHLIDFFGRAPDEGWAEKLEKDGPTRLLESMWRTVTSTKQILDNEVLLTVANGHDIPVERMFYDEGIATVYISANENNESQFKAFMRVFVHALGSALLDEGDKDLKRRPILMCFDEFGKIRLNSVVAWLDTMRSRDIVLVLLIQDFEQLNTIKGESFTLDQKNSIHHFLLFKPADLSNEVAQKISRLSGQTTVSVPSGESMTTAPDGTISRSTSYAFRERAQVEQEDVERWSGRDAYCVLSLRQTEKYVVRGASLADMGWEPPKKARPLPPLPRYVPRASLLPMPIAGNRPDIDALLEDAISPQEPEQAGEQVNSVAAMLAALVSNTGGGF